MRLPAITFSLLLAAAVPAHAVYTTVGYTGTVGLVHAATSGPAGPADIQVGTPVTFSATFDLATAVNRSATINNIDALSGLAVPLPNLETVSLFDDPLASYTVTVGMHIFTSASDDEGGQDFGVGGGHFPLVVYNGSQLLGMEFEADVDGLVFGTSVGAYLLHETRHVGAGYFDANGDYAFRVDTSLDAAIAAAPFAAAIPEPGTWALMLAGIAVIGVARRRRQTRGREASFSN